MWLNVIKVKLNVGQCWPAVSLRVLVRGGQGFLIGAPHGLQLGFGCQLVICILLILSDSSLFAFIPSLPLPLVRVSMHMVSILCNPLTCQCDGAGWVAATHKVVMDTLHVRLGFDLWPHPPF